MPRPMPRRATATGAAALTMALLATVPAGSQPDRRTDKGKAPKPGRIGVILIPDEEPVERAFEEEGQPQFPIEISAGTTGRSHFASAPERSIVAFPRYRVLLHNTTHRTATVHLFAYLTNG